MRRRLFTLILPALLNLSVFCAYAQEGSRADSLLDVLSRARTDTAMLRLNLLIADDLIFVDPDTTAFFLNRAFTLAGGLRDTAALAKYHNLEGIRNTITGRFLGGLEHYQKAYSYYERLGDESGVSKCVNNIGTINSELGRDAMALQNYKEAYQISKRLQDHQSASNALFNISIAVISLGEPDSALHYALELQNFQNEIQAEYASASVLFGEVYNYREMPDSALVYYLEFLNYNLDRKDERFITSSLTSLAELELKLGHYEQALKYLGEAESKARMFGFQDLMLRFHLIRARWFEGMGRFQDAYTNLSRYQSLKDSMDKLNNTAQMNELNARYDAAKREKEIMAKDLIIAEQEASKKSLKQTAFIIIISVLCITGIIGFFFVKNQKINRILNRQNAEITDQRQKIISSINYAQKIQSSILVPEEDIKKHLPDSFIFFKPRDIVSGDFYWFAQDGERIMLSTVDCTGHGVPGAFMSLIANAKINRVVNEKRITEPSEVLNQVHQEIVQSLNQRNGRHSAQDGMDMSFCEINRTKKLIRFAGAQNSIFLINGEHLEEIKADNFSIGGTAFAGKMNGHNFSTREIPYEQGAFLFMCTDGYVDQFGGEEGKKFNKSRFRKLLMEISDKGITYAKDHIEQRLLEWRGDYPQIDDILIIGTRL